jgi:hypothetical protein
METMTLGNAACWFLETEMRSSSRKSDGTPATKTWTWLTTLLSGKPHFVIGSADNPYMLRWFLIPRNHWFNVYLHKFMRDDDDRALHDHPWWFVSAMLKGQYNEIRENGDRGQVRGAPDIAFRKATHRHRVVLDRRPDGSYVPCWTLVITGRTTRTWGFWCPKGFVPWNQFVNRDNPGEVGPGCGE